MRGRPTPARRAPTGGGRSLGAAVVMSMGLCSSAQWGCSLAVNLDGLAASQHDGGSSEAEKALDARAGVGPDVPSSPPPMDAHESGSEDAAGDRQMADREEDGPATPVDGSTSETTAVVPDAGPPKGDMDAAAPDPPGGNQDAQAVDAIIAQPDAPATDTSTGDLGAKEDGGPGAPVDPAPGDGGDPDARPLTCAPSPVVSATLELANAPSGETACGYLPAEVPHFYAAVDPTVFNGSAACGGCVIIQTPAAMVEARIVDLGPSASRPNPTAVAVGRAALTVLAPDGSTSVTQGVDWHFTPCTLSAPGMTFKLQTGSNASYAGVLVENHRYRLAKVEYKIRSTYYPLTRSTYNYWIAPRGMGTGPFTLRLTDELGQTVEQTGIPLEPGKVFRGQAQFPSCSP